MLIDLEFTRADSEGWVRPEFIKEFHADRDSLVITLHMGGRDFGPTTYAERLAPGVYHSYLFTDALMYTKWWPADDFAEQQAEFNRMCAMPPGPEHDALRTKILRRHNEYGIADDLKQVLRYGREFVRSADPYALQVRYPTEIGEKWHKNGPYVRKPRGRVCPEVGCVQFYFHKLQLKAECGRTSRGSRGPTVA